MNKLILVFTTVFLSSCRSRSGGPAQRVGYEMDQAAYKVGGGIKRVGQSIQSAPHGDRNLASITRRHRHQS